jgi:hypothetical protein
MGYGFETTDETFIGPAHPSIMFMVIMTLNGCSYSPIVEPWVVGIIFETPKLRPIMVCLTIHLQICAII